MLEADSEDKTPLGARVEVMQETVATQKKATAAQTVLGSVSTTLPTESQESVATQLEQVLDRAAAAQALKTVSVGAEA